MIGGFILLCFFWGTSWVAIKISLVGLPPFLGASARFGVALAFLALYAGLRKFPLFPPADRLRLVLFTGLLVYWCNYGLIYWAELHLNAGVTALFFSTFPIFTGLLSNFFFRLDQFRPSIYLGLTLALIGVAVVFYDETTRAQASPQTLLATAAVLFSAASGALSALLVKKYLGGVPPVTLTFSQMIAGTGGLLLMGILGGETSRFSPNTQNVLAVIYLGLVASAIAFVLYYWLLQRMSAVTLSLFVYITPLVAILTDWQLLGQELSPLAWIGASVVLAGVLVSQWARLRVALGRRLGGR